MIDYSNWPDGAVAIRKTDDTHIMRFFNKDNEALCSAGWCYPGDDYKTTIATREPEPTKWDKQTLNCRCSVNFSESLSKELESDNTKHLEFMCACYVRGIGYDDAKFLWGLK